MTPHLELHSKLFEFMGALSVCTFCFAWWRPGSAAEDAVVADASEVVIDSIADADAISLIDGATGKNLRDQLSVEQLEDMRREADLRRYPNRN